MKAICLQIGNSLTFFVAIFQFKPPFVVRDMIWFDLCVFIWIHQLMSKSNSAAVYMNKSIYGFFCVRVKSGLVVEHVPMTNSHAKSNTLQKDNICYNQIEKKKFRKLNSKSVRVSNRNGITFNAHCSESVFPLYPLKSSPYGWIIDVQKSQKMNMSMLFHPFDTFGVC